MTFLLVVCTGASAQDDYSKRTAKSVDRALAFLQNMQEKDGSWRMAGVAGPGHPAITSLAILAFLSAGHVPGEGPYGDTVEKGVRWVLSSQNPEGMFARDYGSDLYNQGICTLMLAEVVGMTDAKLAKEIRPKLVKAVHILLKAQRLGPSIYRGGWRYMITGDDADLSVTGWQLMALRAARNVGCDVPGERIDLAVDFVLRCREAPTGAFCYQPGGRTTLACTGTGLLALELTGGLKHKSPEAVKAGSYVLRHPPTWGGENCLYATYYCAQGMFQLGQNYWDAFRPHLYKMLLDRQQENGSWMSNEGVFSPAYSTAMAVLALTVEYRFLPIYQRHEEDGKKK
ncbi:MAG: prenyltransferase/squalene oxidase repeat-containing protein [Gemmataceae bacterium]